MKKNVRRGFTLPEILVTVTVIAVLAAVVVPAVTQFATKGNAPATSGDLSQVRSAITSFVSDTRHYPTDFSDLVNAPSPAVTNWKGPYFTAPLSGVSGVAATFLSYGASVTLGPALTQANSYLSTAVSFSSSATCQDVWNLKSLVDGNVANVSDAGANFGVGNLQSSATTCSASTSPTPTGGTSAASFSATLRLTPIGS